MTDNITVTPGTGKTIRATDNAGVLTPHHNVEFASTPASVNSGAKDAGTLRVVLATDQPALTNALHVIVDSGGPITIQDGGGSVTVDDGGVSLSIDDGGNVISVDDGGGSLTVDGAVTVSGTATVSGDVASGAADSGNPVKVGGVYYTANGGLESLTTGQRGNIRVNNKGIVYAAIGWGDGSEVLGNSLVGDARSVSGSGALECANFTLGFNGATWDRLRTVANGANTTGTGILAAGLMGQFDDVTPQAITENSFGNLRISANRNLYTVLRDGAGNERGANVNASNQLSVSLDGSSVSNLSTNIAQMNGVAVTMGNGVSGTGVQRVTLASDSTGQVALAAGSAVIGALTANQSVNHTQINGSAVSTVAAGVQKVGVADSGGMAFLSAANALNSTGAGIQTAQIVAQFDDTLPTSITENQFGNLRMSANRNLYGVIRDAAGNERGANVNASNQLSVSVDAATTLTVNTHAVTQSGTWTVQPGNTANTTPWLTTINQGGNSATVSAAGALKVDGSAVTQPVSGTVSITANSSVNVNQIGGGAVSTVASGVQKVGTADSGGNAFLSVSNGINSTGTGYQGVGVLGQFDDTTPGSITENSYGPIRMSVRRELYGQIRDAAGGERGLNVTARNSALIEGPTASGSSLAAAPVTAGGLAKNTVPTAVTDGRVVNSLHDLHGRQIVAGTPRELIGRQVTAITSSTSETTIATAGGAGNLHDVHYLLLVNTSTTDTIVTIRDATAGATVWQVYLSGKQNLILTEVPPGAGFTQTAANNNWTAQCGTGVASVVVTICWTTHQ